MMLAKTLYHFYLGQLIRCPGCGKNIFDSDKDEDGKIRNYQCDCGFQVINLFQSRKCPVCDARAITGTLVEVDGTKTLFRACLGDACPHSLKQPMDLCDVNTAQEATIGDLDIKATPAIMKHERKIAFKKALPLILLFVAVAIAAFFILKN